MLDEEPVVEVGAVGGAKKKRGAPGGRGAGARVEMSPKSRAAADRRNGTKQAKRKKLKLAEAKALIAANDST